MFKFGIFKDMVITILSEITFQLFIKRAVYKFLEDKTVFNTIYKDMKDIRKSLKRASSNKKTTLVNIFELITNVTGVNISSYAYNTKVISKYNFELIENTVWLVCDIIGEEMTVNNRRYGETIYTGNYMQELKRDIIGQIRMAIL